MKKCKIKNVKCKIKNGIDTAFDRERNKLPGTLRANHLIDNLPPVNAIPIPTLPAKEIRLQTDTLSI